MKSIGYKTPSIFVGNVLGSVFLDGDSGLSLLRPDNVYHSLKNLDIEPAETYEVYFTMTLLFVFLLNPLYRSLEIFDKRI